MTKLRLSLKALYKNPWIRWLVIPLCFFIFWFTISLFVNSDVGFTTITQNFSRSNFIQIPDGKVLANKTIVGQFTALENNLGIVSVRFVPPDGFTIQDQDVLLFKIKEKNSHTWLYANLYKSGGIYGVPFFPFGFPRIKHSKRKTYVFSITSLHGNNNNAVTVSSQKPILSVRYVFNKSDVFGNKKMFVNFVYTKILYSFTNSDFLLNSIVYLLPLMFYLLGILVLPWLRFSRYYIVLLVPLLIALAVICDVDSILGIFFALIGSWVMISRIYKVESAISFLFSFLFFLCAFIEVCLNNQQLAGAFSNWIYVFLLWGSFQLFWELLFTVKRLLTISQLMSKVFRYKNNK